MRYLSINIQPEGKAGSIDIDEIRLLSAPGGTQENCTLSIDNGAEFTNQLSVQLSMLVEGASQMLIDNTGGFENSDWQSFRSPVTWQLQNAIDEIVTRIVYARFRDENNLPLCSGLSIFDDIVYDPLPPTIQLAIEPLNTVVHNPNRSQTRQFQLHVYATDQPGGSGVTEMQVGYQIDLAGVPWQSYQNSITVSSENGDIVYVRVRDLAGNVSTIHSVSLTLPYTLYLPSVQR